MKRILSIILLTITFMQVSTLSANAQSLIINKTWLEHNVTYNGVSNLVIHVYLTANNLRGQNISVNAYVDDTPGVGHKDTNGKYKDSGGNVCAYTTVNATYTSTEWKDIKIYLPNSEIHPFSGKHDYYIRVFAFGPNNLRTNGEYVKFAMTGASSNPSAKAATASTAKNTNSGSAGSSSSSTVSDKKNLYETYKEALRYYNNKQYTEAFKLFKKAAEQGQVNAQCYLGICYENGYGVTKSYAEAVKWYRKAAEQGNSAAQYNLGICYDNGKGVTQSIAEAAKWYRKAAEQGDAEAQFNLGVCYEKGEGVTQDYAEAAKWYRKAAEQGDAKSQFNLGVYYDNGKGVTQSIAEAVKWFRKAAEQEYAKAQYNLGICYANGDGVTEDYAEAVKWFRKAARQGQKDAQEALRDLGETW